ncbi:MAG: hypothetical protein Q8T09_22015 [Candidatus Melainabacteria bacterium]|nr:hypothetical protein [Candidatus Melainabacteria bacterium]
MANDTKADEAARPVDKVTPGKDGGDGSHASAEAVALLDKKTPAAGAGVESPIKDGSMGTTPPASDVTMTAYWKSGDKNGANSNGSDGTKSTDATAKPKDGSDKSDPSSGLETATEAYKKTLERANLSPKQAEEFARQTADRLQKAADGGKLEGTPEEQLNRMNKAMSDVLDKTGKRPDGKLENGQTDHLTDRDRANLVKDMAARQANPEKFVNQGDHMTCVLQSNQKQRLEAGDPAAVSEQIASVVNKGSAEVVQKDGTTRTVNVDSRSFAPDAESSKEFNAGYHGDQGKRSMAGHVYDALAGQTVADLRSEREGKPSSAQGLDKASYVYMAAHADQLGAKPGQTSTNEALMAKNSKGSYDFVTNSPGVDIWQSAHLSMAMGGEPGAMFASSTVVGDGVPPKGGNYPEGMRVTSFADTNELRTKLTDFQNRTGQSAQILVDAPYLPGGGQSGHGLHAMNITALENGKFKLDNNWASNFDVGAVDAAVVAKATNPYGSTVPSDRPRPTDGPIDPVHPDRPTDRTEIKPGSGRNPNESDEQWNQRLREQKLQEEQKKLEEQKRTEEEKQRDALKKQTEDRDKAVARAAWAQKMQAAKAQGKEFYEPEPQ